MNDLPACVCPHLATRAGLVRSGWSALCPIHRNMPAPGEFVFGGHCTTCTCNNDIQHDAQTINLYLSNIVSKLERDGEWVLTGGDVQFLKRAITLVAKGQR